MGHKVGIVGLERMGRPIAKRLIKAGYLIVGFARKPEVIEELRTIGGEAALGCKEVAQKARTVIIPE